MKTYRVNSEVTVERDMCEPAERVRDRLRAKQRMVEDPDGEWVRREDAEEAIWAAEARDPHEERLRRIEKELQMVEEGRCRECGEKVRGYEAPTGSFAPEAWATLREAGIDPATGHRQGCGRAGSDAFTTS